MRKIICNYLRFRQLGRTVPFLALILVSGCAPAFRVNPLLKERIQGLKTIAVMPMDVEVYKITAGGVSELVDEYSQEAKENIKLALEDKIAHSARYRLSYIFKPEEIRETEKIQLLRDTLALFQAVDTSIIAHTYQSPYLRVPMQGVFQDKISNFDYSLGPQISGLASSLQTDAFLFIRGGDYLSTGGRIALMVLLTILNAAGGGVTTGTNAGPPHLSVALVDATTGDVLWYNFFCPDSGYNFRNRASVKKFVDILLKDFP
jgi:hypothetical protein